MKIMPDFEHMPFIAIDERGIHTLYFSGRGQGEPWRLWEMRRGVKTPVKTGLPATWNHCCPTAEFDNGEHRLTFVAGPPEGPNGLYEMTDYTAPRLLKKNADVGFARWNWTVAGTRHGPIFVEHAGIRKTIAIDGVDYLYRVAFDMLEPSVLLVTAAIDGKDTLLAIPYDGRPVTEIRTKFGDCPYKGVRMPDGGIIHAVCIGNGEERILRSEYEPQCLPYAGNVTILAVGETSTQACPRCFKKHIALALNYAKEILAGHGKSAELDHTADFAAALAGAESHAEALEIKGYVEALRKLRHELDASSYVPTSEHLDLLRRLFKSASNLPPCNCSKPH